MWQTQLQLQTLLKSVPEITISFCQFWTGVRGLSGSISLPVIGWHLRGANWPVFYSYKKTLPTDHVSLFHDVELRLWLLEPILRLFFPPDPCLSKWGTIKECSATPSAHWHSRLQSNSNCSQTTVPKNIKGRRRQPKSAFTDACFFRSNEALRSNAEVRGQTNALAGEGYIWSVGRYVATLGELFRENE